MENPEIKHPFIKFSLYTQIQIECLLEVGDEILKLLKDNSNFHKTYGLIWLWFLGSFEILRTMHEASTCFDRKLRKKLELILKKFEKTRLVFAKQQYKNDKLKGRKNKYIDGAELSVIPSNDKDMVFIIDGEKISFKTRESELKNFLSQIKPSDILKPMEAARTAPSSAQPIRSLNKI